MTETHIPSNQKEKERVEKQGGVIFSDRKGNVRLGHPVWNPVYVNMGVYFVLDLFNCKIRSPEQLVISILNVQNM